MYAATPVTCGQDIDVPESMLSGTNLLSPFLPETGAISDHAAKIFIPGAVKSGCNKTKQSSIDLTIEIN